MPDADAKVVFGTGPIRDEETIASNLKAYRDMKAREAAEAAKAAAQARGAAPAGAASSNPPPPTDDEEIGEASDGEDGGISTIPLPLDIFGSEGRLPVPTLAYEGAEPTVVLGTWIGRKSH